METQALYRKYRPKKFSDVSGQKISIKILENSIKKNIFSHAYIFFGPRGTGKTSVAKIFSRAVNCDDPKDKPCGICNKCLETLGKEAVDIIEIDAASNNGIDDIREIKNKINLVPASLKYKVYIIDEVHMLTTGAFNGLLKTLEEPPEHAIFILATTELNKVPQTILSRCQLIEFRKISIRDMNTKLKEVAEKEKILINDKAIKEISRSANGGLRDALGILDKAVAYNQDEEITLEDIKEITGNVLDNDLDELYKDIQKKKIDKVFDKVNKYYEDGKDLVIIAESLIHKMRDSLFEEDLSDFDKSNVCSMIKKFNETIEKMKSSSYQKVLLDVFLIEIIRDTVFDDEKEVEKPISAEEYKSQIAVEEETPEDEPQKKSKMVKKIIKIKELKEVRVNNTFVDASKIMKSDLIKNWTVLNDFMLDDELGNNAKMLISTEIGIVNDDHIVLVVEYTGTAEEANAMVEEYEKLIAKALHKEYKIVFVSKTEWKDIQKDYIKNKDKEYTHIDESDIIYEHVDGDSEIIERFTELFGEKNINIKGE